MTKRDFTGYSISAEKGSMTKQELRKHDGEAIDFKVEGEVGVGTLNCSATEEKFQIIYGKKQASAMTSGTVDLTQAMIDAIQEQSGKLILRWPSGS